MLPSMHAQALEQALFIENIRTVESFDQCSIKIRECTDNAGHQGFHTEKWLTSNTCCCAISGQSLEESFPRSDAPAPNITKDSSSRPLPTKSKSWCNCDCVGSPSVFHTSMICLVERERKRIRNAIADFKCCTATTTPCLQYPMT